MSVLKKHRIIMLPTNKARNNGQIVINDSGLMAMTIPYEFEHLTLMTTEGAAGDSIKRRFELYILSDEEIKEGDWYLVELFNVQQSIGLHLEQCKSIEDIWVNNPSVELTRHVKNCKKVIASTDKSLRLKVETAEFGSPQNEEYIPQIRESFIKKYIGAYNAGHPIEWVNVEYELYITDRITDIIGDDNGPIYFNEERPKLRSDNTIITHSIKDTFTREEVKATICSYNDTHPLQRGIQATVNEVIEWFDKNY